MEHGAGGRSGGRGGPEAAPTPLTFAYAGGSWNLAERARVVGILNVTPDSFYDGGRFAAPDRAIARAEALAEEGADAIDVGGQSTRPGAAPLGPEEEWERLAPIVPALAKRLTIPLSIDTYHAEVARRAIDHGAVMVNDITGLGHDPSMAAVVAAPGAGLVLMHSVGGPSHFHEPRVYENLGAELGAYFESRIAEAEARGIPRQRIAIDPGIGFSKRAAQSVEALRSLPRLQALGRPLYVGVSRKSFLASFTDRTAEERLGLSLGATVAAYALGARIFRAHDVAATRDAVRAAEATLGSRAPLREGIPA